MTTPLSHMSPLEVMGSAMKGPREIAWWLDPKRCGLGSHEASGMAHGSHLHRDFQKLHLICVVVRPFSSALHVVDGGQRSNVASCICVRRQVLQCFFDRLTTRLFCLTAVAACRVLPCHDARNFRLLVRSQKLHVSTQRAHEAEENPCAPHDALRREVAAEAEACRYDGFESLVVL